MLPKCCKTTEKSNKLHHRLRKTYEKLTSLMKINYWEIRAKVLGTSRHSQHRLLATSYRRSYQFRTYYLNKMCRPLKNRLRGRPRKLQASLIWTKIQILIIHSACTYSCINLTWKSKKKKNKKNKKERKDKFKPKTDLIKTKIQNSFPTTSTIWHPISHSLYQKTHRILVLWCPLAQRWSS